MAALIATCGVWLTVAQDLPSEDEAGERYPLILHHYLGRVRFDAWYPPFKPGMWVSTGLPRTVSPLSGRRAEEG